MDASCQPSDLLMRRGEGVKVQRVEEEEAEEDLLRLETHPNTKRETVKGGAGDRMR